MEAEGEADFNASNLVASTSHGDGVVPCPIELPTLSSAATFFILS